MKHNDSLNWLAVREQLLLQLLVLLPWWWLLPLQISLLLHALLAYRWLAVRKQWRTLGSGWALLLALPSLALLWVSFAGRWSVDAASAFLLCMYVLKSIESKGQRDAQLLVLLGLFVVGCGFLFHQGILYSLWVLVLIYAHLNWLQALLQKPWLQAQSQSVWSLWAVPRQAKWLLLILPLGFLMSALFPRLPPLWQMPLPNSQFVGLQTELDLSSMQDLAQNSSVAFRANFEGSVPSSLYWRGLTLNYHDGQSWQELAPGQQWPNNLAPSYRASEQPLSYEVILPPTGQRLLFSLDYPGWQSNDIAWQPDHSLRHRTNITQPLRYRLERLAQDYQPEDPRVLAMAQQQIQQNPRMQALVEQLTAELQQSLNHRVEPEAEQIVAQIESWFLSQPFFYRLQTPALGSRDQIDRFLFESKIGFCSHYAASLVLMLRHAGVPARMVAGYLGGEPHPNGEYWLIRQNEAHAWVEYYQPGKGWILVDPTAWVAPERVLSDSREWRTEAGLSDGFWHGSGVPWLTRAAWRWDELNYQWQRLMVGFEVDQPTERWRALTQFWLAYWHWLLAGLLTLIAFGSGLYAWRVHSSRARYLRLWRKLRRQLEKQHGRQPSWSAQQWLELLAGPEAAELQTIWLSYHYQVSSSASIKNQQERRMSALILVLLARLSESSAKDQGLAATHLRQN